MSNEKVVKMPEVPKIFCSFSCNNTKCNMQAVAAGFLKLPAASEKISGIKAQFERNRESNEWVLTL